MESKRTKLIEEVKTEDRKSIEDLLQAPYWIIDILPQQVPKDGPGQFFTIERYFLESSRIADIKRKHINVILKLNCYRDISIDDETEINPSPDRVAAVMRERYVYIRIGGAMILSESDDTHMTVFDPDAELLELIRSIAAGEGLFVWQPPE